MNFTIKTNSGAYPLFLNTKDIFIQNTSNTCKKLLKKTREGYNINLSKSNACRVSTQTCDEVTKRQVLQQDNVYIPNGNNIFK